MRGSRRALLGLGCQQRAPHSAAAGLHDIRHQATPSLLNLLLPAPLAAPPRPRGEPNRFGKAGSRRSVPPGESGKAHFTARGERGCSNTAPGAPPERCPFVTRHKTGGGAAAPARGSCLSISALITGTGMLVSANEVTAAPLAQGPKSFHSPTI